MSRVIKFRVWDKELEVFVKDFVIESTGDAVTFDDEGVAETLNAEIMQFTGLLDKNGVDIYEGDIVRTVSELIRPLARDGSQSTGRYTTKHRVIDYKNERSSFGYACDDISNIRQAHATKWLEVVGNIHESPELLN